MSMDLSDALGIDNLVENEREFVGEWIKVRGILVAYSLPGIISYPVNLELKGEKYLIRPSKLLNVDSAEDLVPQLKANLGHEIGLSIFSDNYKIRTFYFRDTEYFVTPVV